MNVERHVSAGGVVYKSDAGQVLVALCHRKSPRLWALPKGTPNHGESIEQTAIREVSEETGLQVRIEEPVGSVNYWFRAEGKRIFKTVHFFLMSQTGGSTALHDHEFDSVEWVNAAEALQRLTYPNEIQIVHRALALLEFHGSKVS